MKVQQKVSIKNQIASILEALHIKQSLHHILISIMQEKALAKLRKIQPARDRWHTTHHKKIIFHSVHSCYLPAIYREGMLAKTLQLMGHDVKMILCGGALKNCTGIFTKTFPYNKNVCKNCVYFGTNFFKSIGLDYAYYSDYVKDGIKGECTENMINHSRDSLMRYYKGKEFGDDVAAVFSQRKLNAQMAYTVAAQVYKKESPNIIVTSHGVYGTWGTFADYFKSKNIPVHCWLAGYISNTLIFDWYNIDKSFNEYLGKREKKLTTQESKKLGKYLHKRQSNSEGCGEALRPQDAVKVIDTKRLETFVMFTNLPWDISLINSNMAFKGVYDWVDKTISLFKKHPQYQLLIKVHPAEYQRRSGDTIEDYINKKFKLPANISIISPNTKVDVYSIFPFIDKGIVYNGTVGLEMAMAGIPTIVCGKTHYSGKGFTYNITSLEEYEEALFKKDLRKEIDMDMTKLYAYYFFIKSFVPIKHYQYKSFVNISWNIKSFDEFLKDKHLVHICNHILGKEIYQDW